MKTLSKFLFALLFLYSAGAFAQEPVLRTSVAPEEAWLGEKVILNVDVLVNEGWAQIIKFDLSSPDKVFMRQMESQGTRISETIDGVSYTGQRYEVMLFSRAEGLIEIPAIPVDVEVKTWGAEGGASIQQHQTPAASFIARAPAGAKGLHGLVSTTDMSADQVWEPEVTELKTGDAIQRTITLRADHVPGMLFNPVGFSPLDGVGIYQKEPEVADSYNRGELSGTRQEAVSYVFEQAGLVEIPEITVYWWNVDSEQLEQITLEGLKVQVLPGAASADVDSAPLTEKSRPYLLLALGVLLGIAGLGFVYRQHIRNYWASYKARQYASEPEVFRRVIKSLRSRDSRASLRDLMHWIDSIEDATRAAMLHDFINHYGDASLKQAIDKLLACANEGRPLTSVSATIKSLKSARRKWKKGSARQQSAEHVLPELN